MPFSIYFLIQILLYLINSKSDLSPCIFRSIFSVDSKSELIQLYRIDKYLIETDNYI